MIEVKSNMILERLMAEEYDPKLIEVVLAIEKKFGEITITSAYRPGDTGVHGQLPCRGLDIRSWEYDDPNEVEDWVNSYTTYDPTRKHLKVALLHDTGRGIHFHLQTNPEQTVLNFPDD